MAVKPRSQMQPLHCESMKMVEDLMFPWTSFLSSASCIIASPLAAPIAILNRDSQSSDTPFSPAQRLIEFLSFRQWGFKDKLTVQHLEEVSFTVIAVNSELVVLGIVISF